MKKLDKTVKKETIYISIWVLGLSIIMEAVFLLILKDKYNYTVILGNLIGAIASIGNFLLLGITLQKIVDKDKDRVKTSMRFSQGYRLILMAVIIIGGVLLDKYLHVVNMWAVIIPLIFPRIAILFRPLFNKMMQTEEDSVSNDKEVEE